MPVVPRIGRLRVTAGVPGSLLAARGETFNLGGAAQATEDELPRDGPPAQEVVEGTAARQAECDAPENGEQGGNGRQHRADGTEAPGSGYSRCLRSLA